MPEALRLHIAGLAYRLEAPSGLRLVDTDPLYRGFLCGPPAGVEAEEISVSIEVGRVPPPSESNVAFDSVESWLAARDGHDLQVFFRSPTDSGRHWWRATVPAAGTPIHLVFAPELLEDDGQTLVNPLHYPLDQLLTMWLLATRHGCILHAAGFSRSGRGLACIGRSGAGKTTLMAQLSRMTGLLRLSDDRVTVGVGQDPAIFGTPWAGEGLVAGNASAELGALVFLHHGEEHRLEAIDARAAAHQLLPTTSIPWFDTHRATAVLATLDELVRSVPAYDLHFRPDPGVVEVVESLFERAGT